MTKEEAIRRVLRILKSPMMMMSPAKEEALNLAEEHGISAVDLIEEYSKIIYKI